ncbi:PliI family lysozyme inhibitor of I-type lysozyme [Pseudomonas sp. N040]|uniref:PliI family lysozyme inhibitor of I-type lysozyme n=1 Tax=Pseudomonas sp. N040 TaxID=2785325 RepID=UPI0018A2EC10|nr:PliI family lysozyme inhibitor of I-type lysozyme [Pseudomonas sp. N040]MBF7728955.1 PliI family lysozyme inhibitor of I-type lysozyme [Pseudomonas sp. N040]MBW7012595.1 PliI family lysozyme inhibitor of I-type lysozyme [Pseudomonas sp. N040]
MKSLSWLALAMLSVLLSSQLMAASQIREEPLTLDQGVASLKGSLKGDQTVDYLLPVAAGQSLQVHFRPDNLAGYFNLLPPGSQDAAIFIGSSAGNDFADTLSTAGTYRIRVYLMRSAARRNETLHYALEVSLSPTTANAANAPFEQTLALHGISFKVSATHQGSLNQLRIVPSGLAIDNSPIEREIDGSVTAAEVADINADGSPELYVYVTSAGSGSYASLVAYSANHNKSLSEIYLPPLADNPTLGKGFMGHDELRTVEGVLVQRFPLYREGDSNAQPTGGTRQIQYKLVPGEANWQLKVDRVVDY